MKKIVIPILIVLLISYLTTTAYSFGISNAETSEKNQKPEKNLSLMTENPGIQKCGTMKVLKEKEAKIKAAFETKATSTFILERPTDVDGGIDDKQHILPQLYNTAHFVLHGTNGTDGGSPIDAVSLEDNNANQIPDFIENATAIFENVWSFEVSLREFFAPPSDANKTNDQNRRNPDERYDIFIYDMDFYGYCYPEDWPDSPSTSFIGIDNNFLGFYSPPLEALKVTAAHEFFHAIQVAYSCSNENIWWMETTATYMEDEAYPDVNDNYQYLASWFLFSDTYGLESTEGNHEYGNFIWAKRLSEDFGDDIIREIWEEISSANGLEAITNALINKNSSLWNEFNKFTTSNFFLEDFYADGTEYRETLINATPFDGVWLEYRYDASTASNSTEINETNVNWDAWMDQYAADYITLRLDPERQNYRINFDGLDITTNYSVRLVTKKDETINETCVYLNDQKDGFLDLSYDTFQNVTLVIANAGNTNTTKPSWEVTIAYFSGIIEVYDLAIIDVKPSAIIVSPGEIININVTIKNNGTIATGSFDVSAWWGEFLIDTKTITNLSPDATESLNIVWTVPLGLNDSRGIWANATGATEELNKENNVFRDGTLTIREREILGMVIEGPYYKDWIEYWIVIFGERHAVRLVSNQ